MEYRSSVTIFAKALLAEAARYESPSIRDFNMAITDEGGFRASLEELLSNEELESLQIANKVIPTTDWTKIIDYLCRYKDAYGFGFPNQRGKPPVVFLPWLASIAICALDDIGR